MPQVLRFLDPFLPLVTRMLDVGVRSMVQINSGSWPNGMKLSPKQSRNHEVIEL
jgi:hypothetical protein